MESIGVGLALIISLFLFILAVLWVVLPFMVAGINKRLDKILKELKK